MSRARPEAKIQEAVVQHLRQRAPVNCFWFPVPSAPGYSVNADGQVLGPRGWLIRPTKGSSGHLYVSISSGDRFSVNKRGIHRLVCEAFHGPQPSPKHEVAHYDDNPENNVPSNLRWATRIENIADRSRNGIAIIGEMKVLARLNDDAVRDIQETYRASMVDGRLIRGTCQSLATKYGVSLSVVSTVGHGRAWTHVA